MKRTEFLEAARTLASDNSLCIVDCLKKKGWSIASDVAEDLGIHISTATKALNSLYDCGLLERRKSQRKTRPAYEYKFKGDRIVLELDLEDQNEDTGDQVVGFYLDFFERLFVKARKMGWQSIDRAVARELGDRDFSFKDMAIRELSAARDSSSPSELRPVFIRFAEKVKRAFVANLGDSATVRLFESAAREVSMMHPKASCGRHLLADMGVTTGV